MSAPGIIGLYTNSTGMANRAPGTVQDDRQMSLLPNVNMPWPPPEYEPVAYQLELWDAWWTGDRQRLAWAYYNLGANSPVGRSYFSTTGEAGLPTPRPGQFRGGLLGSVEYSFWGDPTPPGEKRTKLHVPVASDISQTSASLLFAKPPVFKSTLDGKQAALNNAWFETLVDDHFHARLLEAADMCSGHGGVYLRVVWDTTVRAKPWIVPIPFDVGHPEFSWDVLSAVTFWKILGEQDGKVLRHLEKHIPGQNTILHGLYRGDQTDLGDRVSLGEHPVTARIAADPVIDGDTITFPDQPLDAASVVYVPNVTPNRIWRDLGEQAWPLGRSDYCGVEPLMDALDEAYSSWMRDIQLGVGRIIVPQDYLDNIGRGKGAVFDPSRRVYSPLNYMHDTGAGKPSLEVVQFAIRVAEHQQTCQEFANQIVQQAGYSPQTFGDYDGQAITATEVQSRERRSMLTRSKKINYWRPALADIIYGLMTIERIYFGNTAIVPERPDVEFIEAVAPDMGTLAQTASLLRAAEAVSTEVVVQYVHPDWTPDQVSEEVQRIFAETGEQLAQRARVTLSAPEGMPLSDEIAALAAQVDPGTVPAGVPGDSPNEPSTGGDPLS